MSQIIKIILNLVLKKKAAMPALNKFQSVFGNL